MRAVLTFYYSLRHHDDFCIKMGSDESRFNVLIIVSLTRMTPVLRWVAMRAVLMFYYSLSLFLYQTGSDQRHIFMLY